MQYIIMFTMVVMASVVDIVTGIFKAHITASYDSTVMKRGIYSKALNWLVMGFAIGCELGLERLGNYYDCKELAVFGGTVAAVTVFIVLMLMEAISIFENFAVANPDSPLSRLIGKRLRKMQEKIVKEDENHD